MAPARSPSPIRLSSSSSRRGSSAAAPLLSAIDALEYQLIAAEEQRSHAERLASAGRVAAGLAHEVGNPLCAITNYAHLLQDRVDPELRPTVKSLQREVTRIERMMDGLTDHTRPRCSQAHARCRCKCRGPRDAFGFLGDQGVLRRITVDTQLDGAALAVRGTALELEQVFANLVLNAADAMRGGGRLAIRTQRLQASALAERSRRRQGDTVDQRARRASDTRLDEWLASRSMTEVAEIVVADSGSGVASGDEERIFEPFVTSKPPDQGSGLGLAMVRRLVGTMHGLVWVQPSREGGAAFHIILPLHASAD